MDPTIKAVFLTVALVLAVLVAYIKKNPLNLEAAFAFALFPFVWDAWEAA